MVKSKLVLALSAAAAALALAGCASQPKVDPAAEADGRVLQELSAHAQRASLSMQRLAAMKGANDSVALPDPANFPGMEKPVTISWSGPIEQLTRKIAEESGYSYLGTIGARPATPVSVAISVVDTPAIYILMDAGAQIGSAADLVVNPEKKTVLVKYPPVVRSGGYPIAK